MSDKFKVGDRVSGARYETSSLFYEEKNRVFGTFVRMGGQWDRHDEKLFTLKDDDGVEHVVLYV